MVITAEIMRADMARPFASSFYSFFKPSILQLAVDAGVITEAERDEYHADFQQALQDESFLMFMPFLLVYAQVP
jgi:hypothetical protein